MAHRIEKQIMETTPDRVLVHVTATAAVIRNRKTETPHQYDLIEDDNIELLLDRFDEEFENSLLLNKIRIDTREATVEESLAEFVDRFGPMMTDVDRERMETQKKASKRA